MKPTDWQIGDYALAKPSMMLIKVAAVHHKKVGYHAVTHKLNWVRMDLLEPIPLTEDILKLNGFEQKNDGWLRCEDKANEFQNYIFIQYRRQGDIRECEINYVNIVKANYLYVINYVHELQHALRLCGLNELADNFKL